MERAKKRQFKKKMISRKNAVSEERNTDGIFRPGKKIWCVQTKMEPRKKKKGASKKIEWRDIFFL